MRRFRKKPSSSPSPATSRPSTPTPQIDYITKELAKFYPREKDKRALAASSSAIALSIVSASCDPGHFAPHEPGPSKDSCWGTVYGAVRIAVETAKESSEAFPPLKAVLGALSVLIQSCDQTTANMEQIKDTEERIQSLSEILTSPVDDQDTNEKARRAALRKTLAGIVVKLEPLSEQHVFLKFLNNADHTNILNGFTQDLADAVIDYQTSIQRNIYEKTKEVVDNTNRIDGTTKRTDEAITRINEMVKRSDNAARRTDKTTRRTDETTRRIAEATKRIEEMTKKTDENARNIIEAADLDLLEKLGPVHNAGYQSCHHDACLSGTRESVLDDIMRWAEDPQERYVFWLNGLAGTGKSTIAQTFSEMVARNGTLGASFFCSRDYLDRKELKNIFPTLAYQLACRYPPFRTQIIQVIKRDPSVARNSLISQFNDLIICPLSSTDISCIIVIDALDECVDNQPASALLSVLGRYVKNAPLAKVFITGRPEPRIRTGFRLPLLEPLTQIFLLHGIEVSKVDEDIRLYLREKLVAVAKRRSDFDLSNPWPCEEDLTILAKKSSGLFIFASTLAKFIESEYHEPNERLQLIVNSPNSTIHEGRAGIDPLYTQVLEHAFSEAEGTTVFANFRRVLGAVILAFNPLSRIQIAEILDISPSLIAATLRHLHSVLLIPNEGSEEIRIFHKSFPDFLQDHDRCSDPKFFIGSDVHHGEMALGCLELLKKLKPNPCDLPDYVMNRDVASLPELLEDRVGSATRYACGYWAMHVRSSPTTHDYAVRLVASATEFFNNNAVPWMEVMSLENRLESVIHSIYNLFDWIAAVDVHTSSLRSLAQGCLRFVMHFFHLIQQSAPHIYHSALPLSPRLSTLRSMILQGKTLVTEFLGRPETWGAAMRTIKASSGRFECVTTFSHRVATACDDGSVGIYDSVTGALRLSLSPGGPVRAIRGSPDGSMLFCAHQGPLITAWDIQTGGLIHTFVLESQAEGIAICSKGRYLACGLSDGSIKTWEVVNRTEGAAFGCGSPIAHLCWLEPGEQLVVARGATAQVWDVIGRTVLRSFSMEGTVCGVVYAQKLNRFAIMAASEAGSIITVIEPRTGKSFTSTTSQRLSCLAFSPVTKEFVCGMETPGLRLFSVPARSWRQFDHPATITSVSLLPNGTVVANVMDSGIQLLSLDEGYVPPQEPTISALTLNAFDDGKLIAISPISCDLLESATMSPLPPIPAQIRTIHTGRSPILCASLKHRIALVCCFESPDETDLEMWKFGDEAPTWTKTGTSGSRPIAGISPSGSRVVVLYDNDLWAGIRIWDTQSGVLEAYLLDQPWPTHPLEIKFESEVKFCSIHDTSYTPYDIPPAGSIPPTHSITRHGRLPLVEHYGVDDTGEWVVNPLGRVCWIPLGYLRSAERSYCWAGNTLVMVGHDGTLRRLTFRGQS